MNYDTSKYALVDYCYQDFAKNELDKTDFITTIKDTPDPLVTIIHHTDMDGICSAQIMKDYCKLILDVPIRLVAYNYKKDFNFNSVIKEYSKFIIAVDLSLPYITWYNILSKNNFDRRCLWIDHHVGSVREIYGNDNLINDLPIEKFINVNGCGTKLVYDLVKESFKDRFNERTISLVDTYDRWLDTDDKYWADCLNKYLYSSNQLFVDSIPVRDVLYKEYNKLSAALTKGNTYLQLDKERNEFRYNDFHEEFTLNTPDGSRYKACVLWGEGNSQIFGDHINEFDVVIRANYNKEEDQYYFSFYTSKEDVDCCDIAKQYGGSGHKSASGCMTNYNILVKRWTISQCVK